MLASCFCLSAFTLAEEEPEIRTLPAISFEKVFKRLGDILFYLLVLLAVVFVLLGAISIATSGGDPHKVETGKKMIILALVGILIGGVAFGTVNLIQAYLTRK